MNRLYSNYVPPKLGLTKIALNDPEQMQYRYNSAPPSNSTHIPFSENLKRVIKPITQNRYFQQFADPANDAYWLTASATTGSSAMIPGTQAVTIPVAALTNGAVMARGGAQMLNNWVNNRYSNNANANTTLALDTINNAANFVPGGALLKKVKDVAPAAKGLVGDMLKRPAQLMTGYVSDQTVAPEQNTQPAEPTQAPTQAPVEKPLVQEKANQPMPTTMIAPTNNKTGGYRPPKLANYSPDYKDIADMDSFMRVNTSDKSIGDFIRDNIKADLEIGRRRGAATGTLLGGLLGAAGAYNYSKDNDLNLAKTIAATAGSGLAGAALGNIVGRPLGMGLSAGNLPNTVLSSLPITQNIYASLTQPVFPDSVDINSYI